MFNYLSFTNDNKFKGGLQKERKKNNRVTIGALPNKSARKNVTTEFHPHDMVLPGLKLMDHTILCPQNPLHQCDAYEERHEWWP